MDERIHTRKKIPDGEIIHRFHQLGPEALPAGFYLVRPDCKFLLASEPVHRMLRLPKSGTPKGSIADYYADLALRETLLREAEEMESKGKWLRKDKVEFKIRRENGESKVIVQMFCKPLRDDDGFVIGYYGCLVDKTEEYRHREEERRLREHVDELALDIGRVIHYNSTTLQMVEKALRPTLVFIARSLGMSFKAAVTTEPDVILEKYANRLAKALEKLINESEKDDWTKGALLDLQWDFLEQSIQRLKTYKNEITVKEVQASVLRHLVDDVRDTMKRIRPGRLPKSVVKNAYRAVDELELATLLAPLVTSYIAVKQMEMPLAALRDFLTAGTRDKEPLEEISVLEIVTQATENLGEFADSRGVEIRLKNLCGAVDPKVWGRRRDLLRAISNIIHNAVKYTWHRGRGKMPWVEVTIECDSPYPREVRIAVENWGVPIPEDEYETIFEIGYRGRLATDRYRMGTGIGLADAKRVLRDYGGDIKVESRPAAYQARDKNSPDYYHQPFLTKFTLILPLGGNNGKVRATEKNAMD